MFAKEYIEAVQKILLKAGDSTLNDLADKVVIMEDNVLVVEEILKRLKDSSNSYYRDIYSDSAFIVNRLKEGSSNYYGSHSALTQFVQDPLIIAGTKVFDLISDKVPTIELSLIELIKDFSSRKTVIIKNSMLSSTYIGWIFQCDKALFNIERVHDDKRVLMRLLTYSKTATSDGKTFAVRAMFKIIVDNYYKEEQYSSQKIMALLFIRFLYDYNYLSINAPEFDFILSNNSKQSLSKLIDKLYDTLTCDKSIKTVDIEVLEDMARKRDDKPIIEVLKELYETAPQDN